MLRSSPSSSSLSLSSSLPLFNMIVITFLSQCLLLSLSQPAFSQTITVPIPEIKIKMLCAHEIRPVDLHSLMEQFLGQDILPMSPQVFFDEEHVHVDISAQDSKLVFGCSGSNATFASMTIDAGLAYFDIRSNETTNEQIELIQTDGFVKDYITSKAIKEQFADHVCPTIEFWRVAVGINGGDKDWDLAFPCQDDPTGIHRLLLLFIAIGLFLILCICCCIIAGCIRRTKKGAT